VRVVGNQDWDPSVKSLVAFPQILSMMDEKLDWTQRLGDAFIGQEPQVMDSVQNLRQRAYAAGNLRSNEQIRVEPQGQIIAIEPSSPQVVYVPYYDPTVVYGPWWSPAYPPVYWTPWPGYYVRPGYTVGFAWGGGISVSPGFFFGGFDWHQRRTRVVNVNNYYYNRTVSVNRQSNVANVTSNVDTAAGVWHHDPAHRRGVPYREALLRQQIGSTSGASEARREIRAREAQSSAGLAIPPNRPDARGADSNLPDARVNGRPNTRGAENNPAAVRNTDHARPESRVDARPPVRGAENNPLNVRNGDNNRSDARMNGLPNARSTDNNPGAARTSRENRPEARAIERPDVRTGLGNGSEMRSSRSAAPDAVSRPSLPNTAVRPNVERQPSAFEGAGRRADARTFSPRGTDSSQGVPLARANVPATTPAPAPPAVAASRPAGIHSRPSSPSANPGASAENSKNPESAGKRP
jgi:hypothetical protein